MPHKPNKEKRALEKRMDRDPKSGRFRKKPAPPQVPPYYRIRDLSLQEAAPNVLETPRTRYLDLDTGDWGDAPERLSG